MGGTDVRKVRFQAREIGPAECVSRAYEQVCSSQHTHGALYSPWGDCICSSLTKLPPGQGDGAGIRPLDGGCRMDHHHSPPCSFANHLLTDRRTNTGQPLTTGRSEVAEEERRENHPPYPCPLTPMPLPKPLLPSCPSTQTSYYTPLCTPAIYLRWSKSRRTRCYEVFWDVDPHHHPNHGFRALPGSSLGVQHLEVQGETQRATTGSSGPRIRGKEEGRKKKAKGGKE